MKRRLVLVPLLLTFALGCDRRSEELPEWRPEDHDHQIEPNREPAAAPGAQPNAAAAGRPPMAMFARFGITPEVLSTWKQNCAQCHGLIGRGDGPQGAILRARNFADAEWQRVALDEELTRSIQKGKGSMPAFPQLSPEMVTGLVRFIRLMNPDRPPEAEGAAPADGSSPHGSGPGAPGTPAPGTGSGSALPPGHPAPGSALPSGHPTTTGSLPPGHPTSGTAPASLPPGHPTTAPR